MTAMNVSQNLHLLTVRNLKANYLNILELRSIH